MNYTCGCGQNFLILTRTLSLEYFFQTGNSHHKANVRSKISAELSSIFFGFVQGSNGIRLS